MLWSALQGAVIFALRTVRYLLLGAPRDAESPQTAGRPVEEKR